MKLADVYRLIVTVFVSLSFATGCTNNAEKKASNERKQLSAERAKVAQLQKDAETKQTEIKVIEADLKQKVEALALEKTAWDQDRGARELQVTELSKALETKRAEVEKAEADLKSMTEKTVAEAKSIEVARQALDESKKTTENEIAALKLKTDEESKAAGAKAEEALKALQTREEELNKRDESLKLAQQAIEKSTAQLNTLQSGMSEADKRLQDSVIQTREMFKRDGLSDVFDKLQANKKMKFLVSVVGRGTDKYVSKIQTELDAINQGNKANSKTTSKPKSVNEAFVIDNQVIVEAEAGVVKKFRDDANSFLETENKSGVAASATSLFVVARPIQKIRIGMQMKVNGSKSAGFEKRQTGEIMTLSQIRAIESKVLDVDQVDFTNPGSYVFASDADGRKCNNVDLECLKVLKDKGLLNTQNVLMTKSTDGQATTQISNLEALTEVMAASIYQMNLDYELYTKGMSILAIDYSMDNGFETKLDMSSVKKLWNIFTGTGETRLPIVDSLELSYRIVMVDEISNSGNHIDTWKYMTSGVIQNVQMFPVDRQRNEIEIQLPVGNLKTSRFDFQNLGLTDYKIKTAEPTFNIGGAKAGTNMRGANAAMAGAKEKFKDDVRKERISEYKSRLKINMGMQQVYIETLKVK